MSTTRKAQEDAAAAGSPEDESQQIAVVLSPTTEGEGRDHGGRCENLPEGPDTDDSPGAEVTCPSSLAGGDQTASESETTAAAAAAGGDDGDDGDGMSMLSAEEERAQLVKAVEVLFGTDLGEDDDDDGEEVVENEFGANSGAGPEFSSPPEFYKQSSVEFQNELEVLLQDMKVPNEDEILQDLPSAEECLQLQAEEVEMLEAIFPDELTLVDDDRRVLRFKLRLLSGESNSTAEFASLLFCIPDEYPSVVPVFELEAAKHHEMTMSDADYVYDQLLAAALSHIGTVMVYDLVSLATDLVEKVVEKRRKKEAERAEAEQREREEGRQKKLQKKAPFRMLCNDLFHRQDESSDVSDNGDDDGSDDEGAAMGAQIKTVNGGKKYGRGRYLASSDLLYPADFVGSVSDIARAMPPSWRIVKIENILNDRLAIRFRECWNGMRERYWSSVRRKEAHVYCEPVMAFHGTAERNLPNIVQKGLIVPGTDPRVSVVHGSAYGVGIYTSPHVELSLCYASQQRVIVCAVLLGRAHHISLSQGGVLNHRGKKVDSVICNSQYVVPRACQVLPCYVIDLVATGETFYRSETEPLQAVGRPIQSKVRDRTAPARDETEEQKLQRLKARALKFLPFGYGPVGRKGMVVEAVASFSDDEEREYTDWRADDNSAPVAKFQHVRSSLQEFRYLQ